MPRPSGNRPNDIEKGVKRGNTTHSAFVPDSRTGTMDRYETASSGVHSTGPAVTDGVSASPYGHQPPPFNPSDPGDWVVDNNRINLITELNPSPSGERLFRISFEEMQRMHLRKIQVRLIKHAVDMRATNRDSSPGWEKDLAEYVQATKDFDYMLAHGDAKDNVYAASGNRVIDRWVMAKIIGRDVARLGHVHEDNNRDIEIFEQRPRAIGESRVTYDWLSRKKATLSRLRMAASGAILLLGPMWLMVLHKTVYTGLITTTVCVAILGCLCSMILEKPLDVLSATSAYAAVLVVFVGLTNS